MQSFKKTKSFKKKIKSLVQNGTEPLEIGVYNFNNFNLEIELLAVKRSKECMVCEMFVDEPIEFLRVKDKAIFGISNKMCNECACTLSYKLRQSKTKCIKWQE